MDYLQKYLKIKFIFNDAKFLEQVQNSEKNPEIKYPEGDTLFVGDKYGCLHKISMIGKKTVGAFSITYNDSIYSIAKTPDNKS